MAKKRVIESEEASTRKTSNKLSTRAKRAKFISVDEAISSFLSKINVGSEYVCTVCNRLLYRRNSVSLFNNDKYLSINSEISLKVFTEQFKFVSIDGKMWICRTWDNMLRKGKMPVQAKANGLQLDPIPNELEDLNALELRLISLHIPFMKMVALPSGKQSCIQTIHGPAVNVPSKVDSVCTLLHDHHHKLI